MSIPLSEFPRRSLPAPADTSSRVTGGLLAAVLYALFALLVWWSLTHEKVSPVKAEITTTLLGDVPEKRVPGSRPPFLAPLIRPHAEKPAPPVFTIASGAPPQAPAPLSA